MNYPWKITTITEPNEEFIKMTKDIIDQNNKVLEMNSKLIDSFLASIFLVAPQDDIDKSKNEEDEVK